MTSHISHALTIVHVEDEASKPVLTSTAKPVPFPLSTEDLRLIAAMKEKLANLGGVGLAAPQVGSSRQIIALFIPESAALLRENVVTYPMHIMINPEYRAVGEEKIADFEACYSVNSKAGKVPRFNKIEVSYFDEQGQKHQQLAEGFYARVLQHEIDHLNGILIIDRLSPDCVQGTVEEMMKLRRAALPPEKQKLFDELLEQKSKQ
ncbi:polypeptide deformylase [Legionella birminghamensis]|uniref:Peptide deformylase n=1 Tax=Legionella birminghamensis TaxID=28083 RepID=A0A378I5M7_9GAMM|nr:peptide deformylase [Legionella birminghamensis]KTC73887.1 polypeptide deformylase [Legionella birminghamensis]STX30469.1 polypeptide deformylase [Legionella birminghamensis]